MPSRIVWVYFRSTMAERWREQDSDGGAISDAPTTGFPTAPTEALLVSGFELGPYRIEQKLGAGGMGTVYRAIDTRLGRKVAIKVATVHYGERFQREARAISALNHPNICTLYDVGPNYLVMELLDGSTLAEEIRKGPIAPQLASNYGAQIAAALAEAHSEGIVHRDLKPGNIMLTRHGVKVLDFGLARMDSEQGLTETNVIIGTPAYMAPEQLKGNHVDARTDLFALGLVLYEMVAGTLPFPGASLGSMLTGSTAVSIDPPCKAGTKLASRLNALILGLLKCDPSERPQSATFVRQELLTLTEESAGKPRRMRYALAAGLAGILVLAVIALRWSHLSSTNSARWPEVSRVSPITTYPGDEATPAVSTDGALVAFSWNGKQGGHYAIYVTRSDGLEEPRQLTHDTSVDTSDAYPAWSPDGSKIAFVRRRGSGGGEIILIPAAGGEERKLRDVRMLTFPATSWLTWTPDSAQIVFASTSLESGRSTLFLMRLADGSVRNLISPPDGVIGDSSPALSPDGRSLAFVRWSSPTTSDLLVQKIGEGGQAIGDPLKVPAGTAARSPAWADNQRLLFADGQRIQEWEAGAAAQQIYLSGSQLIGLAIAGRDAKGTPRVVTAQRSVPFPRVWTIPLKSAGLAGGPAVLFSRLGNGSDNPDFSPDGTRIVFVSRRTGNPELWTANADGGDLRQLTRLGLKSLGVPRWSPDNRHVAFFARTDKEPQIYVVDAIQDQAVPQKVTDSEPGCIIPNWSRNGKFLYCSRRIGGEMRLYRVPADAGAGQTEMERWFEGKEAKETSDRRVLYIKDDRPGLFARSLAGDPLANPEERLVEDIQGPIAYFAPVPEGVYYTGRNSSGGYAGIRFFDFARRKTIDVADKAITGPVNSLTVSPDHGSLVYTQSPRSGVDLTLIQF